MPTKRSSLSTTGSEPTSSSSIMRAAMTTEVERLMQRGFGVIASRTVLAIIPPCVGDHELRFPPRRWPKRPEEDAVIVAASSPSSSGSGSKTQAWELRAGYGYGYGYGYGSWRLG